MVDVNEYFEGRVKSFAMNGKEGKKTIGVMESGEYEFNTQTKETITVISGALSVFLAEYDEWEDFGPGASFDIPSGSTFSVKVQEDTAYLCEYGPSDG